MIHIYDAIAVGICMGWITWQIMHAWQRRQDRKNAHRILDQIRHNAQTKSYLKDDQ